MKLEQLESRNAPAVFTYFDIDGDIVTITTSKGTNGELAGVLSFSLPDSSVQRQLRSIDLSANPAFAGTNLTITARRDPARSGDGLASVGRIDAADDGGDVEDTALNLGTVTIKGDLGVIDCGANTAGIPALKSLKVRSMGVYGLDTQGGVGDLNSAIRGSLGRLTVAGDLRGVLIHLDADANGKLGSAIIGGSLIGGASGATGQIFAEGDLGPVTVKGDVVGGDGTGSGAIGGNGRVGSVTIGGSLIGGTGEKSGWIFSGFAGPGDMGSVKIGRDIRGGGGEESGEIESAGTLARLSVGGSILGGLGTNSGFVNAGATGAVRIGGDFRGGPARGSGELLPGTLVSLTIGGSLIGGSADLSGSVIAFAIGSVRIAGSIIGGEPTAQASITGAITTGHSIANLFVGGSIIAGRPAPPDDMLYSGAVIAGDALGPVTVKGSIVGNEVQKVFILADVAIKSLTVGSRVERTDILAGYRIIPSFPLDAPLGVNADAHIGAVSIGGDWIASNLVAGVQDDADSLHNASFGDGDDIPIPGPATPIVSKIASITINGQALGTNGGTDHFAFIAQHIGSFSVAGTRFPLLSGPINDISGFNVGITFDLRLLEVTD